MRLSFLSSVRSPFDMEVLSFPVPYKCRIAPRSEAAMALIESAVMSVDEL